jgi:hypothetical protein
LKGYLDVTTVHLPFECLQKAFVSLRKTGELGVEGVALFVGKKVMHNFYVERTLIPEHTSHSVEEGLYYLISSDELYRLNKYLYEQSLRLIAQIHSHPKEAYHSEADDKNAIVTSIGGLSIVVRNFAAGPISMDECAVFRLNRYNEWKQLSKNEINELIRIT